MGSSEAWAGSTRVLRCYKIEEKVLALLPMAVGGSGADSDSTWELASELVCGKCSLSPQTAPE